MTWNVQPWTLLLTYTPAANDTDRLVGKATLHEASANPTFYMIWPAGAGNAGTAQIKIRLGFTNTDAANVICNTGVGVNLQSLTASLTQDQSTGGTPIFTDGAISAGKSPGSPGWALVPPRVGMFSTSLGFATTNPISVYATWLYLA